MFSPIISIIVPVYNSQDYIIKCLESIKKQTYQNYEVLIINDGSRDSSEKLVLDFIRDNTLNNFRLISQKNGGVSSARNTGLKNATGEWIAFIDSDDWVEPDYLTNMIKAAEQYPADFYLSGFRAYESDHDRFDVWSNYSLQHGRIPEDLKSLSSFDYIWGRLYKKSILDEHQIFFDEKIKYCEDNAFNFDYIKEIKSYTCISEIGYNYRRGHSGAMSKQAINPHMRVHFAEHMHNFCKALPFDEIVNALNENKSFCRVMWNVVSTEIIIDILDKKYNTARQKMKSPLSTAVINAYHPHNKKDKVQILLWKKSFTGFKFFISLFYKNIDKIKKIKWLSHFISH